MVVSVASGLRQVVLDDVEGPSVGVAVQGRVDEGVGPSVDQGEQAVVEGVGVAAEALGQPQAAP